MSHTPSILDTMRRGSITLVSAAYGTDGQLHQNIISGSNPTSLCLPEEGLYVLYRNRGLQIASACDRRKCYITQVCRCTEPQGHIHEPTIAAAATTAVNASTGDQSTNHPAKDFAQDRALSWFNLYEAADEIRSLKLCFLAHPRTLSWDTVFDNFAFHFDSELEEHYASTHSYRCAPRRRGGGGEKGARECPPSLLESIRITWQGFLDRGDHDFRPTTTFPEREEDDDDDDDEHSTDGGDSAYDGDVDDMSEWDDADSPIRVHDHADTTTSTAPSTNHKKRPRPDDDFDLIDDLIEEEFPRLKRVLLDPEQIDRTTSGDRRKNMHEANSTTRSDVTIHTTKPNNTSSRLASTAAAANMPDEVQSAAAAPVIIPPKKMLIGRGLPGCSFGEQRGFGTRSARVGLRVASPC